VYFEHISGCTNVPIHTYVGEREETKAVNLTDSTNLKKENLVE